MNIPHSPSSRYAALLAVFAAFALAVAVYALDRPRGSAPLLPAMLRIADGSASHLGVLGGSLPSLAHAFATSLLTCLLLPASRTMHIAACGAWAIIDSAFEVLQHPMVWPPAVVLLNQTHASWLLPNRVAAYLVRGTFDPCDLAACWIGALAALAFAFARLRPPPVTRTPP